MKIIIAGGRDLDPEDVFHSLNWLSYRFEATEIVSGGAKGAEEGGERWAKFYNIPIKRFNANWNQHGRRAGPIRNREMAKYADVAVLFPGGKGTESMKREAERFGLEIVELKRL